MSAAPPLPVNEKTPSTLFVLRRLFLTVFLRGHSGRGFTKASAPTSVANKLGMTLLFNGVFGLVALAFFNQPIYSLSLVLHALTFFMVGMYVTSSAGEVLFNKEEADILLHRPVTSKSLLQAKAWVFAEVSAYIALSLNFVGLIVGVVHGSWTYPLIHVFSTCLEAVFGTACAVLAYQLCLRWFGRQRLEGMMTTVQVLFSIVLLVGSQLLPRMVILSRFNSTGLMQSVWLKLTPPAWFASLDDAVSGTHEATSWTLGLLGIGATVIVLWLAVEKLATSYEQGWQALNESYVPKKGERKQVRILQTMAGSFPLRVWLRSQAEQASFVLVAAYMLRDRDVKLRLYPSITPFLVMPVMMLFINHDHNGGGGILPFTITISGSYLSMIPMTALFTLRFSQQYKATEIFRLAPTMGPWSLQRGGQIAVSTILVAPIVLVLCIFVGWTAGLSSLWLVLPGVMLLPIYARTPGILARAIPLSLATEEAKAASRGAMFMLASVGTFVVGGFAALAWSSNFFPEMLFGEALLVALLVFLMERLLRRMDWAPSE